MSIRDASEQRRAGAPAALEALEARRLLAATLITPVGGSLAPGTTVDASAAIQDVALAAAEDVAILTPAAPAAVARGDDFDIVWAGGDADTTLQLWAAGPFGWRKVASSVPADAGRFAWDTSDVQGWHAFGAWVNDGGNWSFVASPDWVNVVDPLNRPPQVELLAPAGGNDVVQGINVVVSWRAFDLDGDALRVNVLAWSVGTGFITLASDADRVDSLSWDTRDLPPGSYALRVEAFDGAAFAYDFTGAPIEIIQAPGTGPIFVLQTPNAASQVRRGETFQVLWSFFDPDAVAPRVQIWAFHQQLGWFQVADVDARLGQFALPTTTLPAGTYTFGAWVFSDGFWTEYAAEDTLEILPAAVI